MTPGNEAKAASGDQNHPIANVAVSYSAVGGLHGRMVLTCVALVDVTTLGSRIAAIPTRESCAVDKRIGSGARLRKCEEKRIEEWGL